VSTFDKNNPEIDVEGLMTKIREEAAKKRIDQTATQRQIDEAPAISPPDHVSTGHPPSHTNFSINWPHLTAIFSRIEQNVNAGTENLPMEKFARPYRWMARLVGRIVLLMGEVITNPQRKFNHAVLEALRFNVDVIRQLEHVLAERDRQIAGLEQSLKKRNKKISRLESSLRQKLSKRNRQIAE
jgi:hypothetical protein